MNQLIDEFLIQALREDVGSGDHTSLATIPADIEGRAKLLVKQRCVLAGVEVARRVFHLVDPQLQMEQVMSDGDSAEIGDIAFYVQGSARSITTAERLVLNIMQRMSGIATKTNQVVALIKDTHCKLLDTRKTTPGFRFFEKWAVRIGGGHNHRFGLYDMMMIKDNHIDYCQGITQALNQAKEYIASHGLDIQIEVEARTIRDVEAIIATGGAFRVLLDNFEVADLRDAVQFIAGRLETEASGGIHPGNVQEYAATGVDYLSMGALTHQIQSVDLSLKAC